MTLKGTFDYGNLVDTLINIAKDNMDMDMVLEDGMGDQPPYPFYSFTMTSPHINVTRDVVSDEVFELVLSITCHDKNCTSTLSLAESLRKLLRTDAVRQTLQTNNIAIIGIDTTTNRDIPLIDIYEYRAGFDVHLRVQDSFMESLPQINSVDLKNKNIEK